MYTKEDEDQMKTVVKTLNGNPANVSYWKKVVRIVQYFSGFSADSLRCHWRLIDEKEGIKQGVKISWNCNYDELQTDTESNYNFLDHYRQNDTKNNKPIQDKTPKKLHNPEPKISPVRHKKIEVKLNPSEKKVIKPEFDLVKFAELFEDLVYLCCKINGKKLNEKKVLEVLIENQGVVSETLNFFRNIE